MNKNKIWGHKTVLKGKFTAITNIKNETEDIINTGPENIERIINTMEIYTHKFRRNGPISLKSKLPQLTQYKKNIFSSPILTKAIQFIILKLPERKSPSPESCTGEFQTV